MQALIVQWLNDNRVLISGKLASAIAAVEFHNGGLGLIDELAGELVKELVWFTKEALQDEDNFHNEDDKAGTIYNLISEDCASHKLQNAIDEIEDRLHKWQIGDEIDCLIVEVIACTVQCFDKVTP